MNYWKSEVLKAKGLPQNAHLERIYISKGKRRGGRQIQKTEQKINKQTNTQTHIRKHAMKSLKAQKLTVVGRSDTTLHGFWSSWKKREQADSRSWGVTAHTLRKGGANMVSVDG